MHYRYIALKLYPIGAHAYLLTIKYLFLKYVSYYCKPHKLISTIVVTQ